VNPTLRKSAKDGAPSFVVGEGRLKAGPTGPTRGLHGALFFQLSEGARAAKTAALIAFVTRP